MRIWVRRSLSWPTRVAPAWAVIAYITGFDCLCLARAAPLPKVRGEEKRPAEAGLVLRERARVRGEGMGGSLAGPQIGTKLFGSMESTRHLPDVRFRTKVR